MAWFEMGLRGGVRPLWLQAKIEELSGAPPPPNAERTNILPSECFFPSLACLSTVCCFRHPPGSKSFNGDIVSRQEKACRLAFRMHFVHSSAVKTCLAY